MPSPSPTFLTLTPPLSVHPTPSKSTESIINPDAPLALRLSGQLMLGVVRVYSRKVNYLFQDCSEALVKIKQAFVKDKDVDLPEGGQTAPLHTITLPENYDDLELFFEPSTVGANSHAGDQSQYEKADITLEDGDAFAHDFEEQYAYDDRIHGDLDDDFIVDEMDPGFHPTPGYRTPGAPPRPFGETDANDRVDVGLEDYDEAGDGGNNFPAQSDYSNGDFGAGGMDNDDDADGMPHMNDEDDDNEIAPLPLDEDLEDENGVRGTVVGFKTPGDKDKASKFADGKENAPNTGSTVVLEWGKTAQKANRPEPAKRARSRTKTTTMKLKFDAATILDRESVSRAIKNASDITVNRVPGVIRRVADLADDDNPFAADEERDLSGGATLGYFRDSHGTVSPPEVAAEARALLRGTVGNRDPLMGHRCSKLWLQHRAECINSLWERAGERRGAGFTRNVGAQRGRRKSVNGSVAGDADDVARAMEFDEFPDDCDFGGGFDDDDDQGFGGNDDQMPFTPGGQSTRRGENAQDAANALGNESIPPTPAGAPSGHVDWSTATKRMLADLVPKLEEREVVDSKTGEISVPTPVKVSEMTTTRDSENKTKKVKRSEAARIFYQVLVLKTHGFVELTQEEAYSDISVVAGPKLVEQRA